MQKETCFCYPVRWKVLYVGFQYNRRRDDLILSLEGWSVQHHYCRACRARQCQQFAFRSRCSKLFGTNSGYFHCHCHRHWCSYFCCNCMSTPAFSSPRLLNTHILDKQPLSPCFQTFCDRAMENVLVHNGLGCSYYICFSVSLSYSVSYCLFSYCDAHFPCNGRCGTSTCGLAGRCQGHTPSWCRCFLSLRLWNVSNKTSCAGKEDPLKTS